MYGVAFIAIICAAPVAVLAPLLRPEKAVSLCLAGQSDGSSNEFPRVGSRGLWRIHLCTPPTAGHHTESEHANGKEGFTQVILSATGQLKMMESVAVARAQTRKGIREAIQSAKVR